MVGFPSKTWWQKGIILLITASIAMNPLFALVPEKASAATDYSKTPDSESDSGNVQTMLTIPNQGDYAYNLDNSGQSAATANEMKIGASSSYIDLVGVIYTYTPSKTNLISFADAFTDPTNPAIILTPKDRKAINSLSCLRSVIPNFTEDLTSLYNDVSTNSQHQIDSGQASLSFQTHEEYLKFLKYGRPGQLTAERTENMDAFNTYVHEAEKSYTADKLNQIWQNEASRILNDEGTSIDAQTLSCVTGLDSGTIEGDQGNGAKSEGAKQLSSAVLSSLEALTIDVRVLNTLVYLVTPKDQGGAGHWRIRVARILQNAEKSTESDATNQANNQTVSPTLASASANGSAPLNCDSSMSAADCGSQLNTSNITVSDKDGTEYAAFFTNMDKELTGDRNVSAHFTGQALDISEVDDLRCTLVKYRRIGKSTKTAQPIKPIKLAWQTTDGYDKSGASSNFDQMSMMTELAKQSVVDLLGSMNQNITDYTGDLSKTNFNDLVGILGESLLGQAVGSNGAPFSGVDITGTLQQLGTVYLADYFSLPHEIFQNQNIESLEQFKYVIGRSAIEKKLGLPYGSLNNLNQLAVSEPSAPKWTDPNSAKGTYDLEGLLLNIGQRKVEKEMGLSPHSLDEAIKPAMKTQVFVLDNTALGRIVIEDELNLIKSSWPETAVGFNDLKNYISAARVTLLRANPSYVDSILHIDMGTTKSFMQGAMTSEQYAEKVGANRYNNTVAGLKYFAMSNNAYSLPGPTTDQPLIPDTWKLAMRGDKDMLIKVGVYTLSRLLGSTSLDANMSYRDPNDKTKAISVLPAGANVTKVVVSSQYDTYENKVTISREQYGQFVFREWLRANLSDRITADQACSRPMESSPTLSITYSGQSVYNGPVILANPTANDVKNTVNNMCKIYQTINVDSVEYTDTSGNKNTLSNLKIDQEVSEANAISAGLEHFDMNSIMGYRQADGRAVFERIGAKLLYYAIANKSLSPEEKARIDLNNTNPTLNVDSGDGSIAFYLSRVVKIQDLSKRIKNEWNQVKPADKEATEVGTRIDSITTNLASIFTDSDLDLTKISKITTSIGSISRKLSQVKKDAEWLKQKYELAYMSGQNGTEVQNKINQINALIYDINNMILVCAEMMSGHAINSSDTITIGQINTSNWTPLTNGNQGSTRLTDWQIMVKVFAFLSGQITPSELMLELGAGAAEQNLSLPPNSLLYLAQHYEKYGIVNTAQTFFQSLGQAQIEQSLSLPANYFQGNEIVNKIPKFDHMNSDGNFADLIQWATDDKGDSIIQSDFNHFIGDQVIDLKVDNSVLSNYVLNIKGSDSSRFKKWIKLAQKKWLSQNKQYQIFDNSIDDIVKNISERNFGDNIRSAKNDLLFRMGFPTGIYDGMTSGSPIAWQLANNRATEIDALLGLPSGYTKMLFTGNKAITAKSIDTEEKEQLQSSAMDLSPQMIDKYVQILNGNLLPDENSEYLNSPNIDYVTTNPYSNTQPYCSIKYSDSGGFKINEQTVSPNSFCYYDNKGRHCFQSREEAQRYWDQHPADRITNVLDNLAAKLAFVIGPSAGSIDEIKSKLADFAANKSVASAVPDNVLQKESGNSSFTNATRITATRQLFDRVTQAENMATVSPDTLMTLFARETVDAPLATYKGRVGMLVAGRSLTSKIFDGLGFDIDPTLFTGKDLFNVLTGDFSSIRRMGTTLVDRAMDLPAGTTMLIYTAATQAGIKCALDQAGGAMIGETFGLQSFPVDKLTINPADFVRLLGEEKIEETLSLPRGTFRVDNYTSSDTLANLIKNVGVLNFIIAYKIPINITDNATRQKFNQAISDIFGEQYGGLGSTSANYQLTRTRDYLRTKTVVSTKSNQGRINLENLLTSVLSDTFLSKLGDGSALAPATPSGLDNASYNAYQDYVQQLTDFYNQAKYYDAGLGLSGNTTLLLLGGKTKPSSYINQVGLGLGVRVGLINIGQMLGLDQSESSAATDLTLNIQKVFSCSANGMHEYAQADGTTICGSFSSINGKPISQSSLYHNWGFLYDNLDKVFHFKLDIVTGLPAGTISSIMNNPSATFSIFLGVGAGKLDTQFGFNSNSVKSFSGLYRMLQPTQINPYEESCKAQATSGTGNPADLDRQMATAQSDLRKAQKANDQENVRLHENTIEQLEAKYDQYRTTYNTCLDEARYAYALSNGNPDVAELTNGGLDLYLVRTWEWAQAAAAQELHDRIGDIPVGRENVGINMPVADIRSMFSGDLRYAGAAAAAISANLVIVGASSVSTPNCNPSTDGNCRAAVPVGMRISYDEIKYAIFGLSDQEVRPAAAFAFAGSEYGGAIKVDPDNYVIGGPSGCPAGTLWDGVWCIGSDITNRTSVSNYVEKVGVQYGNNPTNTQAIRADLQSKIRNICQEQGLSGTDLDNCANNENNPLTSFYWERVHALDNPAGFNLQTNASYVADVQASVQKLAADKLKYDVMDIALWKLDNNVYPGFSQSVVAGSTGQRWAAMGQYVRNGLSHGHLFGISFSAIDPTLVSAGAAFVAYMGAPDSQKQAALKNLTAEKFDSVVNFISNNSARWLGFKLDSNITSGLLIGVTKGDWGLGAFSVDGVLGDSHATTNFAGKDRPTFGGAVINFGLSKVFAWTDKTLGLKSGQSYQLFSAAKESYKAYSALQAAKAAYAKSPTAANKDALSKADQKFTAALSAGVQVAIGIIVDKLLGKTISQWEESLGLVQGSLAPVISGAIYEAVAATVNAGMGSTVLASMGPWGWVSVLGMFAIQNLFGVYKVEYWCTADGYFPRIGGPNPSKNDISDIGEFGGKVSWRNLNQIIKNGTITSAQYKARQLIGDLMQMQYNSKYNGSDGLPTVPTQIMTGRTEDVDYWKNTVATNVCQLRLGSGASMIFNGTGALCDFGEKKMGLWQNSQTVAWTHVGF